MYKNKFGQVFFKDDIVVTPTGFIGRVIPDKRENSSPTTVEIRNGCAMMCYSYEELKPIDYVDYKVI